MSEESIRADGQRQAACVSGWTVCLPVHLYLLVVMPLSAVRICHRDSVPGNWRPGHTRSVMKADIYQRNRPQKMRPKKRTRVIC